MPSFFGRVASPPSPAAPVPTPAVVSAWAPPAVSMPQCIDFAAHDRRLHDRLRQWRRAEGNALPERLARAEAQPGSAKGALARLAGTWSGSLVLDGAWDACAAGRDALLDVVPARPAPLSPAEGALARLEQQAWRLQLAPLACLQALVGMGCTLGALACCLPVAGIGGCVASLSVRLALKGMPEADAVAWLHHAQRAFALEQRFGPWAGLDTWLASAEPAPLRLEQERTAFA